MNDLANELVLRESAPKTSVKKVRSELYLTAKAKVESAINIERLTWVLDRSWGAVDGSTHTKSPPSFNEAKINEIAARASKLLQHILGGERKTLTFADASTQSENVTYFPKQKKRGAKVRTGPCAKILPFSDRSASPRLTGEALLSEWAWIRKNHSGWNDEELSGQSERREWQDLFLELAAKLAVRGQPMPTADTIRKEVAECRAIIEKRIKVKDWLETCDVNWDEVDDPEEALSFVFDRMHEREVPPSA